MKRPYGVCVPPLGLCGILGERSSPLLPQRLKKRGEQLLTARLEATPGFEPGIRVLQTHALPLGYVAEENVCVIGRKRTLKNIFKRPLERMTRLELATSTLARWRSTG